MDERLKVTTTGNLTTDITSIVKNIDSQIETENWQSWTPERIQTLGKRGTKQILNDGDIFYLVPCQDLSILGFDALKVNGITKNPQYNIEELYDGRENRNRHRLHFYLTFKQNDQDMVLDFRGHNEVLLYKGQYKNPTKGVTSISTFSLPNFNPTDNVNLAKYQNLLKYFKIEKEFAQIQHLNNADVYNYHKGVDMKGKPEHMKLYNGVTVKEFF